MALSRDSLITYLNSKLGLDTTDVDDETLLFSTSLLDSFSMVDLIMFIEKEGAIKLSPTDVSLDNLDSIGRILRFAGERAGASG